MADNYLITEGVDRSMGADDITSVLYPRIKLIFGADGVNSGDVSDANPFPIKLTDGTLIASIRNTGSSDSLNVAIVDGSGNQITSFGGGTEYTEDVASAGDPVGKATILVRKDTPGTIVTTDGDNIAQRGTNYGAAYCQIVSSSGSFIDSFGGGTQYTEDIAAAGDPVGNATILVRKDTPATITTTDGDNVAQRGTNYGAAYCQIVSSSGAYIDSFGGGTQYVEDVAFGGNGTGTLMIARRDDALATLTPVENDAVGCRVNDRGALWIAVADGSGNQITSFGGGTEYTEDVASAADPLGRATILVRKDTPATITTTDGDNVAQRGTNYGAAYCQIVTSAGAYVDAFGGGTEYTEDAAAAGNPLGKATILVRKDTPAAVADTDGDNVAQRGTNYGAAYCQLVTSSGSYIDSVGGGTQVSHSTASTLLGNLAGNVGWNRVIGDVAEAGSSSTVLNATSHVAKVGDAVRISSGTQADSWSIVTSVAANTITLGFALSGAPATSDTFEIIRPVPITATRAGNGVAMQIALDSNFQANFTSCILKPEGGAHTSGDAGVMSVGVRNDAGATTFGSDGQYSPMAVDANGRIGIADLGGSITIDGSLTNISGTISLPTGASTLAEQQTQTTALQLIDDSVVTMGTTTYTEATSKGLAISAVRRDADTPLANTTNEFSPLITDANGYLKVEIFDGGASHTVDNNGTFAVQVDGSALTALQLIDDPVQVLGTDTYTEATSKGMTLGAVRRDADTSLVNTTNEFAPLQVDNLGRLKVEVFDGGDSHTVDNSGTFAVQVDGAALTALQLIDDIVHSGDAAVSKYAVMGAVFDDSSPATVTENQAQSIRMTSARSMHVSLRDSTGDSAMDDANNALRVNVVAGGAGDGAILDGVSGSIKATVFDYTNANPVSVRLTDTNGDYVGAGAGTQYTEDVASAADPIGTAVMLVRKDTPATITTTDGDNIAQRATNYGAAYCQIVTSAGAFVDTFGGGTQYTEDVAAAADPVGTMLIAVRADSLAAVTTTDGDNIAARSTNKGEIYVKHVDSIDVGSIVPGTGATNLGKAVDSIAGATDTGIAILAVEDASLGATATADGDYAPLRTTARGALWASLDEATFLTDIIGNDSSAAPTSGFMIAGTDGTNAQIISTNVSGHLNIADGGNTITVDGTVAATQSGTWNVTNVSGTVSLPTGAATSANQSTAITALQLIDDPVQVLGTDTYTEATSKGMTIGAVRRDADTTLVGTTNEFGPLQMDANGRLKVEIFAGGDTHPISGTVTASNTTGSIASGSADSGNPVKVGGRAINALPALEANNDRMDFVTDLFGRQLTAQIDPAMQISKAFNATTTQTGTDVWDPGASKRIAVTSLIIGTYGTTAARVILWFGDNADTTYTAGTDQVLFAASFAPSATVKPGAVINFDPPIFCTTADRELHITTDAGISIDVTVHGYEW